MVSVLPAGAPKTDGASENQNSATKKTGRRRRMAISSRLIF
jgi:hypothetical protein